MALFSNKQKIKKRTNEGNATFVEGKRVLDTYTSRPELTPNAPVLNVPAPNTGSPAAINASRTPPATEVPNYDNLKFGQAFAQARAAKMDIFEWKGKKFTTQLASESGKVKEKTPVINNTQNTAEYIMDQAAKGNIDPNISANAPNVHGYNPNYIVPTSELAAQSVKPTEYFSQPQKRIYNRPKYPGQPTFKVLTPEEAIAARKLAYKKKHPNSKG